MADPITALKRTLRERVENMEKDLAMGTAEDFAAYKEKCGEISGVKYAISEVENLRSLYEVD